MNKNRGKIFVRVLAARRKPGIALKEGVGRIGFIGLGNLNPEPVG